MSLVLCRTCSRHIRDDEAACPFCGAAVVGAVETRALAPGSSLSRLSALALAALSLTTTHCQDAPPSEKRAERPPLPSSLPVSSPPAQPDSEIPPLSSAELARRNMLESLNNPRLVARPLYGAPPQPARKKPSAIIHSINTQGHERPGAERVIRTMQLAFLNCYKRTIKKQPQLEGRVIFTIDVDASGTVTQVQVDPISPDRRSIVPCLTAEMQQAAFASSDGSSVITFDMTLSLPRKGPRDPWLDPAGSF